MAECNFQTFKQMNLWCDSHRIVALVFRANEYLQCMGHRICPFVFQINKYVTVTEFDFVFDNKTVREHLKKY